MASEKTLLNVSIKEFCQLLENEIQDEEFSPMIGLGKAGVGKTVSIRETAERNGWGYKELRLCNLSEIDLIGIPTIDEYGGTTYATNSMLPRAERDGDIGILVLDEITSCSPSLRANALQLMDSSRGIGNYKLPKGWKIVCLGNGRDDGGVNYQGIEEAVVSRGMAYKIVTSIEDWKEWAIKKGVNSAVIAFISWKPIMLYVKAEEDEDEDDIKAFPCPRTWELLSSKLNKREMANGGRLPRQMVNIYASGCIGVEVGSTFAGFYESLDNGIITIDELINKTKSGKDIAQLQGDMAYATIANIVEYISKLGNNCNSSKLEFVLDCIIDLFFSGMQWGKEYASALLSDSMKIDNFKYFMQQSAEISNYSRYDELMEVFQKLSKVFN